MQSSYSPEQIEFNSALDALDLFRRMGYTDKSVYRDGNMLRVFCPIHKDQVRRSMIVDPAEHTFRCQYKSCPGYEGGLLLELFAMYSDIGIDKAMEHLRNESGDGEETEVLVRAEKLVEERDNDEALKLLNSARSLNPTNTITRCRLASLYLEMGDRLKGQNEYLAAAEDFAVKGELDKTLSIYNILIILAPNDIKVRRQLAFLFSRLGRPSDAAEHLKWAVDQHLARDEIDQAAGFCQEVTELTPDSPEPHRMLADIRVSHGSIESAMPSYQKAASLFLRHGEIEDAREIVANALRYVPGNPGMKELRDRLNAIDESDEPPAPHADAVLNKDEAQQQDDFLDWIGSLEEEIEKPLPPKELLDSVEIAPEDARVLMCRSQLEDLSPDKMLSMERFLRDMFSDVKKSYENGIMSSPELRCVKEFYKAFCIAFEQTKRKSQ